MAATAPTVNGVDSSIATGVVSPANGVANPEPAFARSAAETVAEVLTQSEAEEVEEYVPEWHETMGRALWENLAFIMIVIGGILFCIICNVLCCRYFEFCPWKRKRIHRGRLKAMQIGQRS